MWAVDAMLEAWRPVVSTNWSRARAWAKEDTAYLESSGFATYGCFEDFAKESQQLYESIKSTFGEFPEHEIFH